MKNKKVIFDTNVWISFLIGKRLSSIRTHISDKSITIITTEQLLTEIILVTERQKMRKYFPVERVHDLIEFLKAIAIKVDINPKHSFSRDPKDNFLLDLIDYSGADYLVTGDKDLLEHNPFKTASILTPAAFEKELKNKTPNL